MGIKGDLKDMSLPNLVQMVCLDRRDVMLAIKHHREGEGVIFFSGGQVVHAKIGSLVGEYALYQMLSWPDGIFEMREYTSTPDQTINLPWNRLLMEGLRLVDEQIVDQAISQIETVQELSPQEIAQDDLLEQDFVLVLARLEQIRAKLAERKTLKQPIVAIQLVADIVNEAATFAQTLPGEGADPKYLANALQRAGETHPSTKLLRIENTHLSANIAGQLYANWSGNSREREQAFKEMGDGLAAVVESYFAYFVSCFRSSAVAGQWRDTCEIFLAELRNDIQNVKF